MTTRVTIEATASALEGESESLSGKVDAAEEQISRMANALQSPELAGEGYAAIRSVARDLAVPAAKAYYVAFDAMNSACTADAQAVRGLPQSSSGVCDTDEFQKKIEAVQSDIEETQRRIAQNRANAGGTSTNGSSGSSSGGTNTSQDTTANVNIQVDEALLESDKAEKQGYEDDLKKAQEYDEASASTYSSAQDAVSTMKSAADSVSSYGTGEASRGTDPGSGRSGSSGSTSSIRTTSSWRHRAPTGATGTRPRGDDMGSVDQFDSAKYDSYDDFLVAYGGDPNAVPVVPSVNLLGMAVSRGAQDERERRRIVERLLADGGDPNFATRNGEDAYMLCLKQGAHNWTAEGLAWLTGRLLAAGLDVGRRDAWGNDAPMLSVCNAKKTSEELAPVWRALLAAGADPTVPGPQGKTSLDWAREFGWRHGFLDVAGEYGYGE